MIRRKIKTMIKHLLKNKKGVTLLEGLIALMLLALVATGTFAVLLSASRKTNAPDLREEMVLAIDKATEELQMRMLSYGKTNSTLDTELQNGLCAGDNTDPFAAGAHYINCLLPPMCNPSNGSSFVYTITSQANIAGVWMGTSYAHGYVDGAASQYYPESKKISFEISCNGFTL